MLALILFLISISNSKMKSNNNVIQMIDVIQDNNSTTPIPTEAPSDSPKVQTRSKIPTIVGILFLIFFTAFLIIFFYLNRAKKEVEYSHGLSQSSLMEQ